MVTCNPARGSVGAGWYLLSGIHIPVTRRSRTRRLNIKLVRSCVTYSSRGDIPKAQGLAHPCRENKAGLARHWAGSFSCGVNSEVPVRHRCPLEGRHEPSHRHKDFPVEISGSGEESTTGAQQLRQKGTGHRDHAPVQAHSTVCLLLSSLATSQTNLSPLTRHRSGHKDRAWSKRFHWQTLH